MLKKIKDLTKSLPNKLPKSKKHDQHEYLVGLDIGTEYIKALVGRVSGDNIEIIGVGRAHQDLNDMQAGAIADISAVVKNCDLALNQAEQQAGVSARTAVLGIAGELVKGATTTIRVSRKDAKKTLNVAEVEQIIGLVQERAEAKAKKQLIWEMGGKEIEIKLVNSALVSMTIDGYSVTNPVGFQGKEVIVQLYTAFAPMIHIGALERTAQELDLDLLAVAAEPFAVSRSVIGNDPNASMSAILMDVGGGTTDIAVVNDGGVQGTEMFGIGGRAFTKSIEKELSIKFEQAEELKMSLGTSRVPPAKVADIETAVNKTLDVWTSGIELALSEFNRLDHLPHRVLLCGGGSSLESLVDQLQESTWYKELPFTRKPTIKHIKPSQVVGIVDKTGHVSDHTYITAMGLLRVGLDTLHQQDGSHAPQSMRERIDRMLRV